MITTNFSDFSYSDQCCESHCFSAKMWHSHYISFYLFIILSRNFIKFSALFLTSLYDIFPLLGLWRYEPSEKHGACVYKSTIINTSKEMMCFSDFPIPKEFPNFMHNVKIMEYFQMYAEKWVTFTLLKSQFLISNALFGCSDQYIHWACVQSDELYNYLCNSCR